MESSQPSNPDSEDFTSFNNPIEFNSYFKFHRKIVIGKINKWNNYQCFIIINEKYLGSYFFNTFS